MIDTLFDYFYATIFQSMRIHYEIARRYRARRRAKFENRLEREVLVEKMI